MTRRGAFRRTPLAVAALGSAAATLLAAAPSGAAGSGPRLTLVRDVQAGTDTVRAPQPVQPDTTVEPSIAVNPANPRNIVTGYQMGRVDAAGDATNGFATSFDSGRTWTHGKIPGLTRIDGGSFDRASDAVVAFGPGNTVYYSSLVFDDTTGNALRSGIVNSTSHDGGRHWDAPTTVIDDQAGGLNDKNWVVVDNSAAPGHHLGRVYVVWDRIAPVLAAYSDDQGKTWTPPSVIYPGQGIGAYPVVLPNGDLAVSFVTDLVPAVNLPGPSDELAEAVGGLSKIVISVAHGAGNLPSPAPLVFTPPVLAGAYDGNPIRAQRAGGLPSAAVDPRTGRIYLAWEDARYRTDAANDAVLTWSDDGGVTWTVPTRINGGTGKDQVDHWNPSVVVDPKGVVRIMYRQRKEGASVADFSPYVDSYLQSSYDDGAHFGPAQRVNRVRTDVRFAAFSRHGAFLGDYNQLAVGGPYVYVVRCEATSPRRGTPATFPPTVYHQTTWVSVLSTGGRG